MRGLVLALLAGGCVFAAMPANAQGGAAQLPLNSGAGYPPQQVLPSPFRCADFTRNSDGSWSPLRPVTIATGDAKATLQPGVSFNAGATYGGVDVAADLNRRCVAH